MDTNIMTAFIGVIGLLGSVVLGAFLRDTDFRGKKLRAAEDARTDLTAKLDEANRKIEDLNGRLQSEQDEHHIILEAAINHRERFDIAVDHLVNAGHGSRQELVKEFNKILKAETGQRLGRLGLPSTLQRRLQDLQARQGQSESPSPLSN